MSAHNARHLFDPDPEMIYLDAGTYGLAPRASIEASIEALKGWQDGTADFIRDWEGAGERGRELFARITSDDEDEIMPPKGKPLSTDEVKLLTQWIKEGALLPGVKPAVATTTPSAPKKSLPPIMSWTNLEGKTIRAGFVRLEGANVVLRMPANGQEVPYPIAKLNAESQKQAQEAGAP